ncbi:hypothetical protein [Desertivirga arenae]|uniref:hypothetical protein n=1 Tax=Desertivirga arenae TaxID=2810309 RepID=UPI001A975B92|nr:hypothetical protein [Pedobacter sp. SYSU D00823]
MPCNHKFQADLILNRLSFIPTTLIIGTFNPSWPETNNASWFYGRTHDDHGNRNNSFWDVLPRLYGEPSLIDADTSDWKNFCIRNQIAITDLITSIIDADEGNELHAKFLGGYADNVIAEKFEHHLITDIIQILQNNQTLTNIYITNGVNGSFWTKIWRPIEKYCDLHGKRCNTLLTPSKNARFSMFSYNRDNMNSNFTMANLNDFILMKWQEQWHFR